MALFVVSDVPDALPHGAQLVNTENTELRLTKVGRLKLFYCVLIYRPPGSASQFLSDFTDFLSSGESVVTW